MGRRVWGRWEDGGGEEGCGEWVGRLTEENVERRRDGEGREKSEEEEGRSEKEMSGENRGGEDLVGR